MPPKLSPNHVVVIPHLRDDNYIGKINEYCEKLRDELSNECFGGRKVSVVIDNRDMNVGEKSWAQVKKGIPLRVEIGPKENR